MMVREPIKLGSEYFLSEQFTETDQLEATIKKNLEVLDYGE
ncbi:MAG: hypothetical protein U5R49_23715 [Deltaproteobacteria bacterium]|nr:hypothetical protein [Deltaproteobacteria bacterium]